MVNEQNLTPKTETIYELKEEYKIPSFEEFMKTYEPNEESEILAEAEYQDQVSRGPRYGPGWGEWIGWTAKKVASTALVVSYFTPAAPFTITATVAVGTVGAVAMTTGNESDQEVGGHLMDVAVDAAIGAAGANLVPGVGQGSSKAVKTVASCCKHCPK
jgi:hypothetical protein